MRHFPKFFSRAIAIGRPTAHRSAPATSHSQQISHWATRPNCTMVRETLLWETGASCNGLPPDWIEESPIRILRRTIWFFPEENWCAWRELNPLEAFRISSQRGSLAASVLAAMHLANSE